MGGVVVSEVGVREIGVGGGLKSGGLGSEELK